MAPSRKSNIIVLVVQVIEVKLRAVMAAYAEKTGQKITYQQLAERSGLSKATLEALGSRPDYNATLSTIDVLCSCLMCGVGDLLEFKQTTEPSVN